jgi:hypothetical protein
MDICATSDGGTDAKAYHTRKFTAALAGFQERAALELTRIALASSRSIKEEPWNSDYYSALSLR